MKNSVALLSGLILLFASWDANAIPLSQAQKRLPIETHRPGPEIPQNRLTLKDKCHQELEKITRSLGLREGKYPMVVGGVVGILYLPKAEWMKRCMDRSKQKVLTP